MAVHGAAARMIVPARYWSASSGPIHAANTCLKKNQPRSAIEKGFTSQFTNSVTTKPAGSLPTPRIAAKSILQHHRVDHEPDQHGDRQVDVMHLESAKETDQRGHRQANRHATDDTQRNPQGKVPLEDVEALRRTWIGHRSETLHRSALCVLQALVEEDARHRLSESYLALPAGVIGLVSTAQRIRIPIATLSAAAKAHNEQMAWIRATCT